jgi:hypothetical protein
MQRIPREMVTKDLYIGISKAKTKMKKYDITDKLQINIG